MTRSDEPGASRIAPRDRRLSGSHDQPGARKARAALLEQLSAPGQFVAGAHLDSPGVGRVTRDGDGFALEYLAPPIP